MIYPIEKLSGIVSHFNLVPGRYAVVLPSFRHCRMFLRFVISRAEELRIWHHMKAPDLIELENGVSFILVSEANPERLYGLKIRGYFTNSEDEDLLNLLKSRVRG